MDSNKVKALLDEALDLNQDLFLISFTISPTNDIEIVVDGDHGVSLEECIRISRNIEHNLDRETEDFALSVKTPDITKPLVHPRQYNKNIGRTLEIFTEEGVTEGKLIEIKDEKLVLTWKTREPKPIGKGKHTVVKEAEISIDSISKAKVKIVYN